MRSPRPSKSSCWLQSRVFSHLHQRMVREASCLLSSHCLISCLFCLLFLLFFLKMEVCSFNLDSPPKPRRIITREAVVAHLTLDHVRRSQVLEKNRLFVFFFFFSRFSANGRFSPTKTLTCINVPTWARLRKTKSPAVFLWGRKRRNREIIQALLRCQLILTFAWCNNATFIDLLVNLALSPALRCSNDWWYGFRWWKSY